MSQAKRAEPVRKTFVGPQLRQLRRQRRQTQAEMARNLGVSASYVNLLENNQRSLSVQVLMAISDAYQVDWRDLINDESSNLLTDLRNAVQDPTFGEEKPDLQELRAAIDHAPQLVEMFLKLHRNHRATLQRFMRQGSGRVSEDMLASSPEAVIHDFFRKNGNYFDPLERAAENLREVDPCAADDVYATIKARLSRKHGILVETRSVEEMSQSLRIYDAETGLVRLSQALDHTNRTFQLA
ncbi:MAG: helix-turn-helix domain-containing protein, partial [Pseudomonadota bacterium]